jgi:sigma-B regulation protein RsbQ
MVSFVGPAPALTGAAGVLSRTGTREKMDSDLLQRFHVHSWGERRHPGDPVLVLGHGFGCDQRVWRFVQPELSATHQVVAFDYMGCGKSDTRHWRPDRYQSLHDHARDLLNIIDALGLDQVVFVGHSVSSSIGMLAAIARPEVFRRLILLAPNPCFVNHPPAYVGGFEREDVLELLDMMDRNMIGWASYFAPVAMKNDDQPHLREELARSICEGDPSIVRHFAKQVFLSDLREELGRVQVPTLVLQAADDAVAPPEVGEYLSRHLPQAQLWRLQATGHCPHMSKPQEILTVLREDMPQWTRR